jgi:hypothetical protein
MAANHPTLPGTKIQDRTGEVFNSWTVLQYGHKRGKSHLWLCRCVCGREILVMMDSLRSGKSTQCADCAYQSRSHRPHTRSFYTLPHQPRRPRRISGHLTEDHCYYAMFERCYNPNAAKYGRYGGRGITICQRWRESFQAFLDDMGPRPSNDHSIDRIDNNGNYEPANCRWATRTEQQRNKSNNHLISFDGQTMCIADWANEVGLSWHVLTMRLRLGWTVERALTEPVHRKPKSA